MQLLTPRLVRMALMIAAKVCKMNFQVSFFIIYHLLIYHFSDYSDSPPPELPSLEERGWG